MKTIKNGGDTFKQVKTIPSGYQVWNIPSIGEGMFLCMYLLVKIR